MFKTKMSVNFTIEENSVKVDIHLPKINNKDTAKKVAFALQLLLNGDLNESIYNAVSADNDFLISEINYNPNYLPVIQAKDTF